MGLLNFLFGKKSKPMTFEEADRINNRHIATTKAKDEEDNLMRQAAKAMSSKNFDNAIEQYTYLANLYDTKRGLYESQVGAAYYFKEEYGKALEWYIAALQHGADKSMMDDNIWEAVEALYDDTSNKDYLLSYQELFPNGQYHKKATALLG
jgi:tetratricopeptide (TPR) repeat protein